MATTFEVKDGGIEFNDGAKKFVDLSKYDKILHTRSRDGSKVMITFINSNNSNCKSATIEFESQEDHDKCLKALNNVRVKAVARKP